MPAFCNPPSPKLRMSPNLLMLFGYRDDRSLGIVLLLLRLLQLNPQIP